jgi:TolB-like protein/Tfp pilus assembly protein PilF
MTTDAAGRREAVLKRKLATILVSDIVGSTAGMDADEEPALRRFEKALGSVRGAVEAAGGRVFSGAGDSVLAEFDSPVAALRAAIDARSALALDPELTQALMRFGLHVAEVFALGDDLKGGGVNIAARIEASAEPGEIRVSGLLYDHVRRVSPCTFEDLGEQHLKGLAEPIRLLRAVTTVDRNIYQTAPTIAHPRPQMRPNSVAVAPFRTAGSEDEDQQFLADGLADDINLELSRIRSLTVCSRSASRVLETSDAVEIGRALGVRYVLSGSVRKSGARVRLNIVLSSSVDGGIIWSERIQRPFEEVLDAMEDIAMRVAATVSGRIDHAAISAVRMKRPENMTAYEYYLRGLEKHRLAGVMPALAEEAVGWFRRAQEADATFARPLAMEVCALTYLPDFDLESADRILRRALELDGSDPELHRVLGILQIKLHGDYAASRRQHDQAVVLAPNDAYIIGRCAAFYIFAGEPTRALELLVRAESLDPFLPVWIVEERIAALYALGQYEDLCNEARSLAFQTRRTRCYRAAARVALGQTDRARDLIVQALAEDPTLSQDYILSQELYEDPATLKLLLDRLDAAGLPRSPDAPRIAPAGSRATG